LVLDDPSLYFGERRLILEYRNGELYERTSESASVRPAVAPSELLPSVGEERSGIPQ
jgi:hypothetical protein